MVESDGERLLVDCGPDLRQQLLAAEVGRFDAVIVTHAHGDHCHGIDELRPVSQAIGAPVPIHARPDVLAELERFAYAFTPSEFYRPIVAAHVITDDWHFGGTTCALSISRMADQRRSACASTRERSTAYAIDFSELTGDMAALYEGVDVWIADCLTRTPHPTHMHLDRLLGMARELRVGQLYLSHMGNGPTTGPWSPSFPTGQRRLTTSSRSSCDDQRPDARRRLSADGDHARARLADGPARAGRSCSRWRSPGSRSSVPASSCSPSATILAGSLSGSRRRRSDAGAARHETRIPMAIDGHFWVDAKVNGKDVKFLVDSGATMTTIDGRTAREAGVRFRRGPISMSAPAMASSGFPAAAPRISASGDPAPRCRHSRSRRMTISNVLGMNFLSSLSRWGVEGRWLVLVS